MLIILGRNCFEVRLRGCNLNGAKFKTLKEKQCDDCYQSVFHLNIRMYTLLKLISFSSTSFYFDLNIVYILIISFTL